MFWVNKDGVKRIHGREYMVAFLRGCMQLSVTKRLLCSAMMFMWKVLFFTTYGLKCTVIKCGEFFKRNIACPSACSFAKICLNPLNAGGFRAFELDRGCDQWVQFSPPGNMNLYV